MITLKRRFFSVGQFYTLTIDNEIMGHYKLNRELVNKLKDREILTIVLNEYDSNRIEGLRFK